MRNIRFAAVLAALTFIVSACGGSEEREAAHLQRGKELYEAGDTTRASLEFRNALQINATNAEAMYYLGLIAEREGNLAQAFNYFRRTIDQDLKHVPGLIKVGQYALGSDDRPMARDMAERALAVDPANADAHAIKAGVFLRDQDYTRAEAEANLALKTDPASVPALSVMAGLRVRQGRANEAIQILDGAIAKNPENDGLYAVKLQILADGGDIGAVELTLRELVKLRPANNAYKLDLVTLLVSQDRRGEAETLMRQWVDATPDDEGLKASLVELVSALKGEEAGIAELSAMIAARPDQKRLSFLLAQTLANRNEDAKAREILAKIRDEEGTSATGLSARASLAQIDFKEGKVADAEALIAEVLASDGQNSEALMLRSLIHASRADYQAAVIDLRAVLRGQPAFAPALLRLAQVYATMGERELAIDAYRNLLRAEPLNLDARLGLAALLRAAGRTNEARDEIARAKQQAPGNPSVVAADGEIAIASGDFATAETAAAALIGASDPGLQADGYRLRAMAQTAQGDTDGGIASLTQALAINPGADAALSQLVRTYGDAKREADAAAFLEQFTAAHPESAAAFALLGDVYFNLGRLGESEAALRKAQAIIPGWTVPVLKLGNLLEKQGKPTEAAALYQDLVARDANDLAALTRLAFVRESLKEYDAARAAYEAILQRQPRDLVASNNLASLIADLWPTDTQALDQARRLTEPFRNASDARLLDTLGWVQFRLGNVDDAAALLERAAVAAPESQIVQYHLGKALLARGERDRAKYMLGRAVAGTPDYRGLDDAKASLSGL